MGLAGPAGHRAGVVDHVLERYRQGVLPPLHHHAQRIADQENVDAGLKVFERKARTVDVAQHGTASIETYVDLLNRVGRPLEAVKAAIELVPDELPPQRIVPLLLDIALKAKEQGEIEAYDLVAEYCKKHNDLLGYTAVLHASQA